MHLFDDIGYLGFLLAVAALLGIGYHKHRISELTIALGTMIEEIEELKKSNQSMTNSKN